MGQVFSSTHPEWLQRHSSDLRRHRGRLHIAQRRGRPGAGSPDRGRFCRGSQEASAEARKKQPDKYIIEFDRRIGAAAEATPGFTEDAGQIQIEPELAGAIGVTLTGVSRYITVKFDSTDGLVAHYQFKTKGATTAGALTDITFAAKAS